MLNFFMHVFSPLRVEVGYILREWILVVNGFFNIVYFFCLDLSIFIKYYGFKFKTGGIHVGYKI